MTITREESKRLLRLALGRNYEPRVRSRMPGIVQHEFDGSTSFDFNTGRIHNASWPGMYLSGQFVAAESSFKSWNKGGGRVLAGLTKRRTREWETIRHGKYHSQAQPVTSAPSLTSPADVWDRLKPLGQKETTAIAAVKAFQSKHGLKVDGLVGPATRSALIRAEEAKRTGQATAGGGVAGGAVGGGADVATDPNVTLETFGTAGSTALVVAAIIFAGFMIWRFRGPLFSRLPEPAKDFAQDRLGITIGRRVAVPAE